MKKGYYICVENCGSCGVHDKIAMQIATFSTDVDIEKIQIKNCPRTLPQRVWELLPWNSFSRYYDQAYREIINPDFLYVRRWHIDKKQLAFFARVKKKYPSCKIIVEIPTYPYFREMCSNIVNLLDLFKEVIYKNKNKTYVDRFVTYSDDELIFGVPTIRTMNGINTASITISKNETEYTGREINLLAVALFARHHGYERIIKGMYDYYRSYNDRSIYFHIVGIGSELPKYKKLVQKYKLEKYIFFYGEKHGDELNEIYNIADIGVAALGVYKDAFSKLSTLKAREYMAKGLPVILGADDDLFTNCKYGEFFPNDSSPINMERVVEFADRIYLGRDRTLIASDIREYVMKKADNSVTLKPIMDYINSEQ